MSKNTATRSLHDVLTSLATSIATKSGTKIIDPNCQRLIQASVDIATGDVGEILFQHSILCQCGMPYRDPGPDVLTWTRKNGDVSFHMRASDVEHPDGQWKPVGLPFGPKPRLILMHLNGEALRQQRPCIEVDATLTKFVQRIDLPSKGKNINAVKTHVGKLANTQISLAGPVESSGRRGQVNTNIVEGFDLWFTHAEAQQVFWPATVTLSPRYFESLMKHAVPLSETAIAALRNTPLALDIYTWLAQRLHRVKGHQGIPWPVMQAQFGEQYKDLRFFRRDFTRTLKKVLTVYPDARVEINRRGVQLYASKPPIAKRLFVVKKHL